MSQLLPEGIDHLGDCPYTLHAAILTGLRILNYDEFPKEERPPKDIWLDGEKLDAWWTDVEKKREERYATEPSNEEGPYEENDVELISRG